MLFRSLLNRLDSSVNSLKLAGKGEGCIDVVFLRTLGIDFLPKIMRGFLEENPTKKIDFNLYCDKVLTSDILNGLKEKKYDLGPEVLRTQLKVGLSGVKKEDLGRVWVAYEPVWSIGVNGTPATADYAERMHKEIKNCLVELFGEEGREIPALYGGSVNPGNAEELIVQPSIDGLFVGRAAWQADKFNDLIRMAKKKYESQ